MSDRTPYEYAVDIPQGHPRTTIVASPAPPAGADHTTPPAIDLQVATVRDGIEVSVSETLLTEDVDALIAALTDARGQANRDAEAAGYFAWVAAGRPDDFRP